jgi:hypothetical protein
MAYRQIIFLISSGKHLLPGRLARRLKLGDMSDGPGQSSDLAVVLTHDEGSTDSKVEISSVAAAREIAGPDINSGDELATAMSR